MKVLRSPKKMQEVAERLRRQGKSIGFVPTMGALHEGHLSLVRRARKENDRVVVSLFVNPLQFGPKEDLKRYPRPLAVDQEMLKKEKTDFLFLPSPKDFYPAGYQTFVEVTKVSGGLCGAFRPGHFRGVATVVAKLFNLVRATRVYVGAKDYQQACLVKQLVRDLNFDLQVRVMPLVRERSGLALSSRNRYLSASERERALTISKTLKWIRDEVRRGNRNLAALRRGTHERLRRGLDRIDYVSFVQPETLQPVIKIRGRFVAAVAGWVGKTRLIDNVIISR